jgi:hypothetical protein
MKSNILYIALIALVLTYVSCNKISESLQRDTVIMDSVLFKIPVITNVANEVTISIASPLNFEEQVNAQVQGLSLADLSSVKLRSADLDLLSRDSGAVDTATNFGNLLSVKMQIADGIKADSLASIRIPSASLSATLTLVPVILPETLKPYVSGSAVRYNVLVKAKKTTTKVMEVKMRAVYTFTLSK